MTASKCVAASWIRLAYSTTCPPVSWRSLTFADELGKADYGVEGGAELMAHIGNEFGLDLARQPGFDAYRVLGLACPLAQHSVGDKGRVLAHQGVAGSRSG